MKPSIRFTDNYPVLEKGEVYHAEDFILKAKGDVEAEEDVLDTRKLGEHEVVYTVSNAFMSETYTLKYKVVDTTPPVLKVVDETVYIDPDENYTMRDMRYNIIVNEGNLFFESDLDPSIAGSYQVIVRAIDESENTSEVSYTLVVRDTEPPFVFDPGYGAVIKRGNDFVLNNWISYGDNADPDPVLEVEGTVNTEKVGNYPLHLTLTDNSGNVSEWDLTVKVVNKIDYDGGEEDDTTYLFDDFMKDYQGEGRAFGIDVSEWQGEIDFEKAKRAGCEFVMMRIGYSYNGNLILDKSFRDNFRNARAIGIPVGIYYYSNDSTPEEVRSVMRQIFEELGDDEPELPIVFDWENFTDFQDYKVSFNSLNELYDVFEEEVRARGFEPMLYGSKYYLERVWNHRDTRSVWLAHYVDESSYKEPYSLWQTAAWGELDGVEGYVDLDVWFR